MRQILLLALALLSACAAERLAPAPPAGVDFTGRWQLNEADSDDPQRLLSSQSALRGRASGGGSEGAPRGRGGRGGAAETAPAVPAVSALIDAVRWPGKALEVKQTAGSVAMTSVGEARLYQPFAAAGIHGSDGRRSGGRGGAHCGWERDTLVIEPGDPDDDSSAIEKRFSLSADGRRLIEVVAFVRGGGFAISRVWDRIP